MTNDSSIRIDVDNEVFFTTLVRLFQAPPVEILSRADAFSQSPAAHDPEAQQRIVTLLEPALQEGVAIDYLLHAATQLVSHALVVVPAENRPALVMSLALSMLMTGNLRAASMMTDMAMQSAASEPPT